MNDFYQKVSDVLAKIVKDEYDIDLALPFWELPPKQEYGDLSSMVTLKLAAKVKKYPLDIAAKIKTLLEKRLKGEVDKIDILKPGFINLFISKDTLINSLNTLLKEKDVFFRQKLKKKVILEFVSANPTGPLSIPHGRQAIVGDVIGNILEFLGNDVEREYYLNDEGRQIDLLVESVEAWLNTPEGSNVLIPEGGYNGGYVKDIADEISANKEWVKNKETFDLRGEILNYTISLIKKDLESLGVEFSNWFSQRKLIKDKKVEAAISYLQKKGLIYEEEGALWFASTKFGDDKDRVIKKKDGELTYFASDIAYHKDKIDRGANQLINLWGPDHHGYIERVKSSIKAQGLSADILKIVIIQLVNIKTKERMSRRKGTAVLLSDLVNDVGKDAARFYYLVRKNSSHLEFDLDLAKEASFNNPLYYIQYACARIESIFTKAAVCDRYNTKYSKFLKEDEEMGLLRVLLQFSYCLDSAYHSLEPVFIIEYLKNLAAVLHKFYEKRRVLVDDENVTGARLNLLESTKIVIHCGLRLLGIEPVKKM
ncbi:MAG: arginine--tRNA ligase [Candidatus Omnitrophota bacterium]|nr:arginine--tRNA ligase [Candidatus Omnitrophota bacterium]